MRNTINAAMNDETPMTTMNSISPSLSVNGDPDGMTSVMTGKNFNCSPIHCSNAHSIMSTTIVMSTVPTLNFECFPMFNAPLRMLNRR